MSRIHPLVSVVMCTYNDGQYIAETIESVLTQTFTDFEFIIWNDGSTDSTERIIKSYEDLRIRYFFHENTGLGMALNLACQQVKGKYIARIDGDDICLPTRLEKQITYMEKHPDCVLLSSSCYYIDENGKIYGRSLNCTWNRVIKKTLKVGSAIIHPAAMYRTDVYRQISGGYLPLRNAQDRVLWSKMAQFGKFANLDDALIKYRTLATSLSHIIENNPYSNTLECLRRKIIADDIVLQDDINIYNVIYLRAKEHKPKVDTLQSLEPKIEEKVYQKISPIIGEVYTAKILIFIKNIYCFILK